MWNCLPSPWGCEERTVEKGQPVPPLVAPPAPQALMGSRRDPGLPAPRLKSLVQALVGSIELPLAKYLPRLQWREVWDVERAPSCGQRAGCWEENGTGVLEPLGRGLCRWNPRLWLSGSSSYEEGDRICSPRECQQGDLVPPAINPYRKQLNFV